MKIFIRTDSSHKIGTGHVVRCINLANLLKSKYSDITFICRKLSGSISNRILSYGFKLIELPRQIKRNSEIQNIQNENVWLNVSYIKDVKETISVIKDYKVNWLIIDHYGIDFQWQKQIRKKVNRIMVIDDLANRIHDCDILLDQNYVNNINNRYSKKVPDNCNLLLGPKYALLSKDYKDSKTFSRNFKRSRRHILLFFGGSDSQNLTTRILNILLTIEQNLMSVNIVINKNNHQYDRLCKIIEDYNNVIIHTNLPSLSGLIKKSDFAIGSGGVNLLERCVYGLPSIVITTADNQKESSKSLNDIGAINLIGHYNEINDDIIIKSIMQVMSDIKVLSEQSIKAKNVMKNWNLEHLSQYLEKVFV